MKLFALSVAAITTNFAYQYFNAGDYMVAIERSYFQSFAFLSVAITDWLFKESK